MSSESHSQPTDGAHAWDVVICANIVYAGVCMCRLHTHTHEACGLLVPALADQRGELVHSGDEVVFGMIVVLTNMRIEVT